jgi:hypothetical protein
VVKSLWGIDGYQCDFHADYRRAYVLCLCRVITRGAKESACLVFTVPVLDSHAIFRLFAGYFSLHPIIHSVLRGSV